MAQVLGKLCDFEIKGKWDHSIVSRNHGDINNASFYLEERLMGPLRQTDDFFSISLFFSCNLLMIIGHSFCSMFCMFLIIWWLDLET